ncbi:MAG: response regulator [Ignavibacteriaceae bacterium]
MKKVLLVDDDVTMFYLIKILLRLEYTVDCFNNAESAVKSAKENEYSLMLVDINLGSGLSGIDVLREIRRLNNCRNTPVIAITAFAMTGDREEFLNMGFTEYISKPFNKTQLLNTIERTTSVRVL